MYIKIFRNMKQMKISSICLIRISEGEKRDNGEIFIKAITKNFPKLVNDINLQLIIQRG